MGVAASDQLIAFNTTRRQLALKGRGDSKKSKQRAHTIKLTVKTIPSTQQTPKHVLITKN